MTGARGVPDVAYDADPNSGVAVYSSVPDGSGSTGWMVVGGTSAGAPQWSALVVLADQERAAHGKAAMGRAQDTLKTGADNLVLADTNEEGANLLSLQTRQQLSSTALSIASQSDRNVLSGSATRSS